MRIHGVRLLGLVVSLLAALLTQVDPAAAVGGTCGSCRGRYESCMEARYENQGYVTADDEELCASFEGTCWAMCQSSQPMMCSTIYNVYACGHWYSGINWQSNYQLSHYCSDYVLLQRSSNCG